VKVSLARWGALFAFVMALLSASLAQAADAKATVEVQAAKGSERGKELGALPVSLKPFSNILATLGFGKFEDTGKDSGAAAAGATVTLKAGGYQVEITVTSTEAQKTHIQYVIKDSASREVGKNTVCIRPSQPATTSVGDAANPVVLIISRK